MLLCARAPHTLQGFAQCSPLHEDACLLSRVESCFAPPSHPTPIFPRFWSVWILTSWYLSPERWLHLNLLSEESISNTSSSENKTFDHWTTEYVAVSILSMFRCSLTMVDKPWDQLEQVDTIVCLLRPVSVTVLWAVWTGFFHEHAQLPHFDHYLLWTGNQFWGGFWHCLYDYTSQSSCI